jgi:hypothetical protein
MAGKEPEKEPEVLVELATRIPKSLHRELKLHCVTVSMSVMDFVTQAIEERLARSRGAPAKAADRGQPTRHSSGDSSASSSASGGHGMLRVGACTRRRRPMSPAGDRGRVVKRRADPEAAAPGAEGSLHDRRRYRDRLCGERIEEKLACFSGAPVKSRGTTAHCSDEGGTPIGPGACEPNPCPTSPSGAFLE